MMKKAIYNFTFLLLFAVIFGCNTDHIETTSPFTLDYKGLSSPDLPTDNRLTIEGIELGRQLFYEKALSEDGTLSCASCHQQANAFADTNTFSIGTKGLPGKRQAMAIFNMAWNTNGYFWDGRAERLRHQALLPIQDHLEMNETISNVLDKLNQLPSYNKQFTNVFENGLIDSLNLSLALEQFMFSIVSNNSKYDKVKLGLETYTEQEQIGHDLFFNSYDPNNLNLKKGAECFSCHSGSNFENDLYMNNGLDGTNDQKDKGRQNAIDNPNLKAKFKVPSLRNIEITPPYMHDGRFKTLIEVINHYDHGIKYSPTVNPTLISIQNQGLNLNQTEKEALIAFLKTLTDYSLTTDTKFSDPN